MDKLNNTKATRYFTYKLEINKALPLFRNIIYE